MQEKKKPVKKTSTTKRKKKKANADKYLVIVESPAKSRTINKILGKNYKVMASMGHLVDLPLSSMGIDFENDFKPNYIVMKGKTKHLTLLKKEAKNSKGIYLAADPDREGEAICWHLKTQFEKTGVDTYRVSFDEITQKAVKEAFDNPRDIDMNKVDAQQARRILDRIVGYSLSPLLWKRITRGLSAGRVQSVAVRLIVDRENEIRNFVSEEYWSLDALLKKINASSEEANPFKSKLIKYKNEKVLITTREESEKMVKEIREEKFIIKEIKNKNKNSFPRSPFTTSLLQQEAFNKLNFAVSKTMRIAQGLYEGIELGKEGSVGLITYMRTDSFRISDDAQKEVREYIKTKFGDKYCPEKLPQYKAKKGAQEAHEAIRPTLPLRSPDEVASFLSVDELKLYTLIWNKFVSSQMTNAVFSVLTVLIDAGEYRFRAGGSRLIFDGFLKMYRADEQDKVEENEIPHLEIGEEVSLIELLPDQHFTQPPPRYTDASLVKILEEKGIGRPSTYAPTINTIVARNYIKRVNKSLHPTELGELVNKLLVENFPDIVDDEFTARMESELDTVEEGRINWVSLMRAFYDDFSKKLEIAKDKMSSMKKEVIETDEICEKCSSPMVIKWGRRGRFLSCSDFPTCKNSKSITTGVKCPEENCDGELVERKSSRGAFYGCSCYPKCTYTSRKLTEPDSNESE